MSGRVGPLKPSFINTYSMDFDGLDEYVGLGNPIDLQITGAFSFSCWVNTTSTNYEGIYFKGNSVALNDIYIRRQNNGTVRMFVNGTSINVTSSTTVNDGNWHHIMCVYVPSTSMTIYIDGIQDAQNTTSIPSSINNNYGNISIGEGGGQFFNGKIDEASIFNNDQSANIATLSASPAEDLTSLSPIAWYRMGDNGSYKSPQWLLPNNENKDKVSNYSMDFDGVNDYVSVSDNSIGQTQNISYSIWVNLDVTTRQYIIGNQNSSNGGCGLQIESGDILVFQMADGGNDSFFNSRVANFSTYAPINTWNHILATWDGTDAKIYINGILRNTWSPTLPYTISGYDTTFNIGWRAAGFSFMTNGKLDELALFNSGVSISDVWDGSGQPIDVSAVSGITNNWRMGENASFTGTNWTIPDNVGSNDGTSANMTIEDRVGSAPSSSNNAVSFNMEEIDRVPNTP